MAGLGQGTNRAILYEVHICDSSDHLSCMFHVYVYMRMRERDVDVLTGRRPPDKKTSTLSYVDASVPPWHWHLEIKFKRGAP